MDINFNIAFLKTVSEPLMASIEASILNVQENINLVKNNNVTNASTLQITAIDKIHEAKSVLLMIDLVGVHVILDKTEEVLQKLKDGKLNKSILNVLQTVHSLLEDTKLYIEQLKNGVLDNPSKLFGHYKSIASYTSNSAVSSYDLFFPKIDLLRKENGGVEAYYKLDVYSTDKLEAVKVAVQETSNSFAQRVGSGVDREGVKELISVIEELQNLNINKHWHILLLIIQGYFSYLSESTELHASDSEILEEISGELRRLNKSVSSATIHSIKKIRSSKDFQKNILYNLVVKIYTNKSLLDSAAVKSLNEVINLNSYLDQIEGQEMVASVLQLEPLIIQTLNKDFQNFKEEFIIFAEKDHEHGAVVNKCDEIFLSLKKLNLLESANLIKSIKELLAQCVNNSIEVNNYIIDELSIAINFLERLIESGTNNLNNKIVDPAQIRKLAKRLNTIVENKGVQDSASELPELPELIKENENSRIKIKIYEQLVEDLVIADEIINNFFRTKGENKEDIKRVVEILDASRGVLSMTGKPDLSLLMLEALNVFKELLITTKGISVESVRQVSNYIAAIHLYAEALKKNNKEEADNIYFNITSLVNKEKQIEPSLTKPVLNIRKEAAVDLSNINSEPIEVVNVQEMKFADKPNNAELCDIFVMEFEEVVENLDQDLEQLRRDLNNPDLLKNVRRYFHTLKGSSRMIGFNHFAEAPWIIEQTLNKKIELGESPDIELLGVLKESTELIKQWMEDFIKNDKRVFISNALAVQEKILPFNPKAIFSFNLHEPEREEKQEIEQIFQKEMSILLDKVKVKQENMDFFILQDEGLRLIKNMSHLAKVSKYEKVEAIAEALLGLPYVGDRKEIEQRYNLSGALSMIERVKNHDKVSQKDYNELLSNLQHRVPTSVSLDALSEEEVDNLVPIDISVSNNQVEDSSRVIEKPNKEEGIYMSVEHFNKLLSALEELNHKVEDLTEKNESLQRQVQEGLSAPSSSVDIAEVAERLDKLEEMLEMQGRNGNSIANGVNSLQSALREKQEPSIQSGGATEEYIKEVIDTKLAEQTEEVKSYTKKLVFNAVNLIKADLGKKKGFFF